MMQIMDTFDSLNSSICEIPILGPAELQGMVSQFYFQPVIRHVMYLGGKFLPQRTEICHPKYQTNENKRKHFKT